MRLPLNTQTAVATTATTTEIANIQNMGGTPPELVDSSEATGPVTRSDSASSGNVTRAHDGAVFVDRQFKFPGVVLSQLFVAAVARSLNDSSDLSKARRGRRLDTPVKLEFEKGTVLAGLS